MINLLPKEQKLEISILRQFILISIWEFLIASFLISLILIFLLVKIPIQEEIKVTQISLAEKEKELSLNKELEKKIENFNLSLSQIYSFYQNQIIFSEVLEKIIQTIPQGIYLTNLNISLSEKKGEPLNVSLSGFSPNRDLLLSFKENLEKEVSFSEIFFPIETWTKKENINFSLTFKIK